MPSVRIPAMEAQLRSDHAINASWGLQPDRVVDARSCLRSVKGGVGVFTRAPGWCAAATRRDDVAISLHDSTRFHLSYVPLASGSHGLYVGSLYGYVDKDDTPRNEALFDAMMTRLALLGDVPIIVGMDLNEDPDALATGLWFDAHEQ